MCLIIHKPLGGTPDFDVLYSAELMNPDGFGITYLDGDFETIKTMDYNRAASLLESDRPYVAHYRYATRGKVSQANCHPFPVAKHGGQLFSNGTVASLGNAKKTDTEVVAETLAKVPRKYWHSVLRMTSTRFAYVSPDGKVERFGRWHKHEGCWYSKDDYFWDYVGRGNNYGKPRSFKHSAKKSSGVGFSGIPEYDEETGLDTEPDWRDEREAELEWWNEQAKLEALDDSERWGGIPASTVDDWDSGDLLAVYGTLKRGFCNNHFLGDSAVYLGKAVSSEKLRMQDHGIPYVYRGDHAQGKNIQVELYLIENDRDKQRIDDLEGHPTHYRRAKAYFVDEELNEVEAWLYYGQGTPDKRKAFIACYE